MFASRIFVACVALLAAPAVQPARTAVDLSSGLEFPPQDQQLGVCSAAGCSRRRLVDCSPSRRTIRP
jgi:hypothetical protein